MNNNEERLRTLLLRAVLATALVLAALAALRMGGVVAVEPDAPIQAVEDVLAVARQAA